MSYSLRAAVPYLLPTVFAAAGSIANAQSPSMMLTAESTSRPARPTITIQSPALGEIVRGVTIIRFRAENVSIESPFLPKEMHRGPLPAAHLHVTVDGTTWHWIHATTDPIVVTPLMPGDHTVTLELAGADHRPLDSRSVKFTVDGNAAGNVVAREHAGHR
jgi:hypothetical protein